MVMKRSFASLLMRSEDERCLCKEVMKGTWRDRLMNLIAGDVGRRKRGKQPSSYPSTKQS